MASDQTVPIPFKQTYQFQNMGPSPTNKNISITIYVPESEMLDQTDTEISTQSEKCLKKETISNFSIKNDEKYSTNEDRTPISCSNSKCFRYQCWVQPPWKSNEIINITVEQMFLREKANELNIQNLTVITYAEIQSSNVTSK